MTSSAEPTTPQPRAATSAHEQRMNMGYPVATPPASAPATPKRGPLRTTRDVLACIRDVLLIIVLAAMLIFGGALVKGLSDVNGELNNPDVGSTECIGEEPC